MEVDFSTDGMVLSLSLLAASRAFMFLHPDSDESTFNVSYVRYYVSQASM